jgi:hypothetical protein
VSAAAKKKEPDTLPAPAPDRIRLAEANLSESPGFQVGVGKETTNWLSETKGFTLHLQRDELGQVVLHAKHRSGAEKEVPLSNVTGYVRWREPTEAERKAALPQEMGPIRAEEKRRAEFDAAMAQSGLGGMGAQVQTPVRDIRPTVRRADLGATALAYFAEHGHVLIGGVEHRVV